MTTLKLIYALVLFMLFGVAAAIPVLLVVIENSPWLLIGAWSLAWLILILRWIPKIVESESGHE